MHASKSYLPKLISLGLFWLTVFLYINSLHPTISWRDSPEFVAVSYNLDISHPAGSPTYSLLSKLSSFISIGNVPLRSNFFSALASSLCISLIFIASYYLFHYKYLINRYLSCIIASLSLFSCKSLWGLSLISEVYTLQNLLIVLLLFVLIKAHISKFLSCLRYQYVFALLYGLSLGVHAAMIIFIPVFFMFLFFINKKNLTMKNLVFLLFFFLMGFMTYLYLPIRSLAQIPFDWGNPETFSQFLNQILDKKDSSRGIYKLSGLSSLQSILYVKNLSSEFSVILIIVGVVGLVKMLVTQFRIAIFCLLVFISHTIFFLHLGWSASWGYTPSYVVFSLFISSGIDLILSTIYIYFNRIKSYGALLEVARYAIILLITFIIFLPIIKSSRGNFSKNSSKDYSAEIIGKKVISDLPLDSVLFANYLWFPLLYFQHVEHRRPDLTFILQAEAFFPKYFESASQARFPNITHVESSADKGGAAFEYFWRLAYANAFDHLLFWELNNSMQDFVINHISPYKMIFLFDPHNISPINREDIENNKKHMYSLIEANEELVENREARLYIIDQMNSIANFWAKLQNDSETDKAYHDAIIAWPKDQNTNNNYGSYLMSNRRMTQAAKYLKKSYEISKYNTTTYRNLAELMFKTGNYGNALYFHEIYTSASRQRKSEAESLAGAIRYELKDYDVAVGFLESALKILEHESQDIEKMTDRSLSWIALYRDLTFEQLMKQY